MPAHRTARCCATSITPTIDEWTALHSASVRQLRWWWVHACSARVAQLTLGLQDPVAKVNEVKAAQKFFSEDKERAFEAKVCNARSFILVYCIDAR